MSTKDTVLSIDLGTDDCLYRILRETTSQKRVLYVDLKRLDIIPEDWNTYGPRVIRELSKLEGWQDDWKTLTIHPCGSGVRVEQDAFKPHGLTPPRIVGNYPYFDILELQVVRFLNFRVYCVLQDGKECIMKIARFGFELRWIAQEVKAYHALACRGSSLTPRMLGYVYEETRDRVVGFLIEKVSGRCAGIADLERCHEAMRELHAMDIVHGDNSRYNIRITDKRVKFIDLEDSCVGPIDDRDRWNQMKMDEMQRLPDQLAEETGRGRPLTEVDV